jgi:beta-glucosidase-like glycosyl hydrolase
MIFAAPAGIIGRKAGSELINCISKEILAKIIRNRLSWWSLIISDYLNGSIKS